MPGTDSSSVRLIELEGEARERVLPTLKEGFVGIYRWHAKRTLRGVSTVRAAVRDGAVLGFAMLERLVPEVGYVYYLAVGTSHRREGVGGRLLDDALDRFRGEGVKVVYAAAEEENQASLALFRSRGFRTVARDEPSYREGGLGAQGLRSRMWVVSGEVLLGLRLAASHLSSAPADPQPGAG